MLTKKDLENALEDLPEKFTIEDILDRVLLLQKIEMGLEQSLNNEIVSDDKLDEKFPEWLR